MNEQEAKNLIIKTMPKGNSAIDIMLRGALDIAIKALEKQIPKRPVYEADGYADGELVYDYAECPECGHLFEYGINDWCCNHCSDCGQKLDWSAEE